MNSSQALILMSIGSLAGAAAAGGGRAEGNPTLRAGLESLSRRTIFFGHQSVGGNILEGLRSLAVQEGVSLHIVEAPASGALPHPSFGHALIPANGDPQQKLRSFELAFTSGQARGAEVAFLKFCYVDFSRGTDVPALFARYQETLRRLEAHFPGTTFVHLTAPLTTAEGGFKATIKDLLGRETSEELNARREEFNALMRQAWHGTGLLFDLAGVEATAPDGRRRSVPWRGREVPALAAASTDDGGHLNGAGRERVARALVAFLEALPPGPSR